MNVLISTYVYWSQKMVSDFLQFEFQIMWAGWCYGNRTFVFCEVNQGAYLLYGLSSSSFFIWHPCWFSSQDNLFILELVTKRLSAAIMFRWFLAYFILCFMHIELKLCLYYHFFSRKKSVLFLETPWSRFFFFFI